MHAQKRLKEVFQRFSSTFQATPTAESSRAEEDEALTLTLWEVDAMIREMVPGCHDQDVVDFKVGVRVES